MGRYGIRQPRSSTIGGGTLVRMHAVSNQHDAVSTISGAPLILGLCRDPRGILILVLSKGWWRLVANRERGCRQKGWKRF